MKRRCRPNIVSFKPCIGEPPRANPAATVSLTNPQTLWFPIPAPLCTTNRMRELHYIASSPDGDGPLWSITSGTTVLLPWGKSQQRNWPVTEIAFTGGEHLHETRQILIEISRKPRLNRIHVLDLTNANCVPHACATIGCRAAHPGTRLNEGLSRHPATLGILQWIITGPTCMTQDAVLVR